MRLTKGSAILRSGEIVLTLPGSSAPAMPEMMDQSKRRSFLRSFCRAAMQATTVIRESRILIVHAIQNNFPVSEAWVAYSRTTESKVGLVFSEIANAPEHDGLLPLHNELGYTWPDSFDNDPLDTRMIGTRVAWRCLGQRPISGRCPISLTAVTFSTASRESA